MTTIHILPSAPCLFIAGERIGASARSAVPVEDPATGEILAELPLATSSDIEQALEASRSASSDWRRRSPVERGSILRSAARLLRLNAEQVAVSITREEGKPLQESRVEVETAAQTLEWFAEEGRRAYGRILPGAHDGVRFTVVKDPVGPVASFAPWNFPAINAARKIGAALAAGCTCIHKPAEEAPSAALAVGLALQAAGLPPGVLSVVFGNPAEVSAQLIASPVIQKVSFTGSVPVGRQLMKLAADHGKRTTMELGGHAPVIVTEDVDVEKVVAAAVGRKFQNAGQVCISPTRFQVHAGIFDEFVERFSARVSRLRIGQGLEPGVQMGPLAHERRPAAVSDLVTDAMQRDAVRATRGDAGPGAGHFHPPVVLARVPKDARIMAEEPFGPVAIINPFHELDEAIAEANRLPFGLAAYAFTESARSSQRLARDIVAGMLGINSFKVSIPDAPFLGLRGSGHGAEAGPEGLEACLVTRVISYAE